MSNNNFTVVTDSKLLVSGQGTKPAVGTKLMLKLSVSSDGKTKYSDTKHADGTISVGNKLLFSNEYPEFSAYAFVDIQHFKDNLSKLLMVDDSGVKYITVTVIVPTFVPSGTSKKASL